MWNGIKSWPYYPQTVIITEFPLWHPSVRTLLFPYQHKVRDILTAKVNTDMPSVTRRRLTLFKHKREWDTGVMYVFIFQCRYLEHVKTFWAALSDFFGHWHVDKFKQNIPQSNWDGVDTFYVEKCIVQQSVFLGYSPNAGFLLVMFLDN